MRIPLWHIFGSNSTLPRKDQARATTSAQAAFSMPLKAGWKGYLGRHPACDFCVPEAPRVQNADWIWGLKTEADVVASFCLPIGDIGLSNGKQTDRLGTE